MEFEGDAFVKDFSTEKTYCYVVLGVVVIGIVVISAFYFVKRGNKCITSNSL